MHFVHPVEQAPIKVCIQHLENIKKGASQERKPGFPEGIMFELDPEGYVHLIGMNFKGIPGRGNNMCKDIGCLG